MQLFGSFFFFEAKTARNFGLHYIHHRHTGKGAFFSSILESLFGSKEQRILILGLDNAGKTTILCFLQTARVTA